MIWAKYISFFFLSMIKFLFTPFGGPAAQLSFIETYLLCVTGALASATLFFFASGFFIKRAEIKRRIKMEEDLKMGNSCKKGSKFTKTNKLIIRLKQRFGLFGITFFAPLLMSIPVGTIIVAKFYGKERSTFPLVVLGITVNGFFTTSLAFVLYGW